MLNYIRGEIMKRVAVLFANGFEEVEALSVVDVMKRANIECLMIGLEDLEVTSSHDVTIKMDDVFNDELYDMDAIVLPGGMPGANNLKEDERVITLLQSMNQKNRIIGAICAGPIALQQAGIINGKKVTCYPGFDKELVDAKYTGAIVQIDGNIVTGNGPAAALAFAYTLVEQLGENTDALRQGMQYNELMKNR